MIFSIEAFIQILLFSLLPSLAFCSLSLNTLTPNLPVRDGDVLVSSSRTFALGFFSPGKSRHRYVGVWYNNVPKQTIVWVANRDNPVKDSSGVLSINGDGGLVIHGKDPSAPIWSANITLNLTTPNNSVAKLLDTGNLVLLESESSHGQRVVWEGFNYPTDTFLDSMKIGLINQSTRSLTSWKSKDDPGTGSCTFEIDGRGIPQLFLYKVGNPLWRGGPWIGDRWSGLPGYTSPVGFYHVSFVNNRDEISYMVYAVGNISFIARGVVDESGAYQRFIWSAQENKWANLFNFPDDWCDTYGRCGPNSNCDPYKDNKMACTCLPGFEPKSPGDWYLRVGVQGCIRKAGASACRNGEGFVKVARVKVPDTSTARVNMSLGLKDCELECLMDCSCTAYTSADIREGGTGCVTWHGDMMDIRSYSSNGVQDLYVRVDAMSLARYSKKSKMFLARKGMFILLFPAIAMIFFIISALWRVRRKAKGSLRKMKQDESEIPLTRNDGKMNRDLAIFDLNSIVVATDNFSTGNKLGEGGFGSVYKGILANGQEVAVKRLSMNSRQGYEEFKNEVTLIANLQHRNLVRLYGCCISSEEKMLIYEYLPNKSLDFYIFDKSRSSLMNWKQRFNIINGIARGILYLHQDSRLKVVHRDIKASNVLLDSAMNPKISDFGLAKMFGEDQIQANTKRVVGTYGYMSPEYAMQGRYSTKSDVFSFGVLLLEIISGKRNTDYDLESPAPNLIGAIWHMWREGRALEIVDPTLNQSYPVDEVSRCIHVSLLCMQECATDRPTMSEVVFMLGNETALPSPKKAAFILQSSYRNSSSAPQGPYSVNDVTITMLQAR